MAPVVVDTNVPLIANGRSTAGPECTLVCSRKLNEVKQGGLLVLDDGWRILKEYMNKLSSTGQPGPGDAFLKWVLTHHANPRHCTKVAITSKGNDPEDFEEFPEAPDLANFDRSDRKFVAVAMGHSEDAPILQGFDSKWWGFKESLRKAGVEVRFLCPREIAEKYDAKTRSGAS